MAIDSNTVSTDDGNTYGTTVNGGLQGDVHDELNTIAQGSASGPMPRDLAGEIMAYRPTGPEFVNDLPVDNAAERMGRITQSDLLSQERAWRYMPVPNEQRKD